MDQHSKETSIPEDAPTNGDAATDGPLTNTNHSSPTDDATEGEHQAELARAAQASLRATPGAFLVTGPGVGGSSSNPDGQPPSAVRHPYTNDNLPPNIDIIAEAELVTVDDGGDEVDTLGLGLDEEANLGGVMPDSTSVAMWAITQPYTPSVPDSAVVHPANCEPAPGGSNNNVDASDRQGTNTTSPLTRSLEASANTPPPNGNSNNGGGAPIAHAEPMDKMAVYAFGTSFRLKKWHFILLACMVLVAVVVPLAVVLPNKNDQTSDEEGQKVGVPSDESSDTAVATEEQEGDEPGEEVEVEPEPVLMELPVGVSRNEECEYQLYENNSTFTIDSVSLNGEPISSAVTGGTTVISARPGSKLRLTGKASTCSDWCATCLSQLYITLMDYDDGNIYDACKYLWSGLNTGVNWDVVEEDYDIVRAPPETTSNCFDFRINSHCKETDFDEEVVLNPEMYPANITKYGIVLSLSSEYLCQEELLDSKLNILGVSDEYFLKVEGEAIVDEKEIIQEPTVPVVPRECDFEIHNNTSTLMIEGVYVNNVTVTATEDDRSTTIIPAMPGDTIRVKGRAATCAKGGEGTGWCPGCWVQLYVSLMGYDEDVGGLYDPCQYLYAPQVIYDGENKGEVDLTGAPGEPVLIRPQRDLTSKCIETYRLNGDCNATEFDSEIAIGQDFANYAIALTLSSEYYCQESFADNRLRVLRVSDDYIVQIG